MPHDKSQESVDRKYMHENNPDSTDLMFTQKLGEDEVEKLGQLVEDHFQTDPYRTNRHLIWAQNIRFIDGKQYLRKNASGLLEEIPKNDTNKKIPRPTFNYIRGNRNALVGIFSAGAPHFSVEPRSHDFSDTNGAKASEIILDDREHRDKEDELRNDLVAWFVDTGNCFKTSRWDPEKGPLDDNGDRLGDIRTESCSPFEFTVNPQATGDDDIEWIMRSSVRTLPWIHRVFNNKNEKGETKAGYTGLQKQVEQMSSASLGYASMLSIKNMGEGPQGAYYGQSFIDKNSAIVHYFFERPSTEYKEGRLLIVAGTKLLYYKEGLDDFDMEAENWHPYEHANYYERSGSYWGSSAVSDGVELQRECNRCLATIQMVNKRLARPLILNPKGSGVKGSKFTSYSSIVDYNPQPMPGGPHTKPEIMQGGGVTPALYKELEDLIRSMSDIMGVRDVLKGERATGVQNYSMLKLLEEQAMKDLNPIVLRLEAMYARDARNKLALIKKHLEREDDDDYTDLLTHLNKDINIGMLKDFFASNLNGNGAVRVQALSISPRSRAVESKALIELAQYKIIDFQSSPALQAQAARAIAGNIAFPQEVHVEKAEWENQRMLAGDYIDTTDEGTNNSIHKEVHDKVIQSPAFYNYPKEIQERYIEHNDYHSQLIQQEQEAQKQAQIEALTIEEDIKAQAKLKAEGPKNKAAFEKLIHEKEKLDHDKVSQAATQTQRDRELDIRSQEAENAREQLARNNTIDGPGADGNQSRNKLTGKPDNKSK